MAQLNAETAPDTHAIIGALFDVHTDLGCGFLEATYQEALALELEERGIPFEREVRLPIHFKGRRLKTIYRADFVCGARVLLELKAQRGLTEVDTAQVIHYLRASELPIALLANFGTLSLEFRRLVGPAHSDFSREQSVSSV